VNGRKLARLYGRTPEERIPRFAELLAELRDKPARSKVEDLQYAGTAHLYATDLWVVGRRAEAKPVAEEAVAATRHLYAARPRLHRSTHVSCLLTRVYILLPDLPESRDEVRALTDEAFDVLRPWLDDTSPTRVRLVSRAYGVRGQVELSAGDVDTAETMLRRASETSRRLPRRLRTMPDQLAWHSRVVEALAACRSAKGDAAGAERFAAVSRDLAEASRRVRRSRKEMWAAISEVGDVLGGRTVRVDNAED
jgi:hypothetical protein